MDRVQAKFSLPAMQKERLCDGNQALMQPLTLQPTFEIDVELPLDEFMPRMRQALSRDELRGQAITVGNCIDFTVDADQQRFWSPHLTVQVSPGNSEQIQNPTSANHSKLYCRFSPRPEIWTMFMAIYAIILGSIFIAAVYGYVQWILGNSPWAALAVPVGFAMIAALHVGSKMGQSFSSDQMHTLKQRLNSAIELSLKSENIV